MIITILADALAPYRAWPSADTELTKHDPRHGASSLTAYSPFHEISASWHCLEFQPITGAAALQCGTVCCYCRQAAGDLKEMHWKVVAENEVVDVRSVFTRVNLTVGTIQKVVTEVQIRKMFTDLEVIRLYWPCHLFVSPACTAQFCTRCAVH